MDSLANRTMKKKSRLFSLLFFILTFLVSTFLFTLPRKNIPSIFWLNIPHLDKFIHIGIFFTLCFTAALAIYSYKLQKIGGFLALLIAGVFILYGVGVEFYQEMAVEGRSFERGDIFADAIGCTLFLLYIRLSRN